MRPRITTINGIHERDLPSNIRAWVHVEGEEWSDATTPRTDNPIRFLPYMGHGVSVTYRMRFHWPA